MSTFNSRQPNDCAIIAASNYLGMDYDAVIAELSEHGKGVGINYNKLYIWKRGTPAFLTRCLFIRHGLKKLVVPRRGQEKISGIVSVHVSNNPAGHMFCAIDGKVFDCFAPDGLPIREYNQQFSYHIREIWK